MGYISKIKSQKTGETRLKVFWIEDTSDGRVIQHSKNMPLGTSYEEAKDYMHKMESATFRHTGYSNTGYITLSAYKDKVRFVVHWKEKTDDGQIILRQKTLDEGLDKVDALRFLKRKEKQFYSNNQRKGVF